MGNTLTAIGLMSGTSLDGVDAALVTTDGENIVEQGPSLHLPYDRDIKVWARRAIKAALEERDGADEIGKAANDLTHAHIIAVESLLEKANMKREAVNVIGFHGQTILHKPSQEAGSVGRTWQIGDGASLATETGIDVVGNFRMADMQAGGEGAPFAPIYHRALVAAAKEPPGGPVGILNLGGVSNVTYVPEGARGIDLVAFDCGPGNGLIDEWVELKSGEPMDKDGAIAAAGKVHEDIVRMMLLNPYLRRIPPKSLDRYDFKIDAVKDLSMKDGAATLTAFTAACVEKSIEFLPAPPVGWVVCGGGRKNPVMMDALRERISATVLPAEDVGWRGDDLEAECFAYLAVRSLKKLPLSYPKTTRVPKPMLGGVYYRAAG